jgi:hypothetical protein
LHHIKKNGRKISRHERRRRFFIRESKMKVMYAMSFSVPCLTGRGLTRVNDCSTRRDLKKSFQNRSLAVGFTQESLTEKSNEGKKIFSLREKTRRLSDERK